MPAYDSSGFMWPRAMKQVDALVGLGIAVYDSRYITCRDSGRQWKPIFQSLCKAGVIWKRGDIVWWPDIFIGTKDQASILDSLRLSGALLYLEPEEEKTLALSMEKALNAAQAWKALAL